MIASGRFSIHTPMHSQSSKILDSTTRLLTLSHYLHFLFIEQHAIDFLDGHVSRFLRLKVNKPIPFGLAVLIKDNLYTGKGGRALNDIINIPLTTIPQLAA